MSFGEQAIQQLYENSGLTDELTDSEAKLLLKWGEQEVMRLDAQQLDEDTFEDRFKQVRRAMNRINSFIGKRSDFDDDKAKSVMARFTEGVYELGYTINQAEVNAFLSAQQTMNNHDALVAMLDLMQQEETANGEG